MRQELHISQWRSEAGSRLWLSMLIATMDDIVRPESRLRPVDAPTLEQLRAQLALPASARPCQAPPAGLRH